MKTENKLQSVRDEFSDNVQSLLFKIISLSTVNIEISNFPT